MAIEQEIKKLMSEYDLKIELCDKKIEQLQEQIRLLRKVPEPDPALMASIRKEKAIEQAVRQSLVQAKSDVDSLLDYV